MKKSMCFFLLACFTMLSGYGETQDSSVAGIKIAQGSPVLIRGTQTLPAVEGGRIMEGDVLRTGPDGSLGLIFKDDTILAMGPSSEVAVTEFLFVPADKKLSFVARVIQGTASFITGAIGKLSPKSVRISTPKALIGIRGTHVLVKVDPPST